MESKLYHANCFDIFPQIADGSVDLLLVDLPYGTTNNPWDSVLPLDKLWEQYNRIVKVDGAMIFTAAPPFDKVLAISNLDHFKYEWIWHKNKATGFLNANRQPLRAHETVLVFYRQQPTYNPQVTSGHVSMNPVYANGPEKPFEQRNYNQADQLANTDGRTTRQPRSVIDFKVHDNINPNKIHPTQKPLALMEYFIRTYSNEGDVVMDNTMGAGTTCVAAKGLSRNYIGIELEEKYYKHACAWIDAVEEGSLNYKNANDLVNVDINVPEKRSTLTSLFEDQPSTLPL